MKICILDGGIRYHQMFKSLGFTTGMGYRDADMLCFTGGADVSPILYGEATHPRTFKDPSRDEREVSFYREALEMGIPMVGICRGSQFLHVMNGGKLYQDVDNHADGKPHIAKDRKSGETIIVTSTHHQMMRYNVYSHIVTTAERSKHKERVEGNRIIDDTNKDLEVLWYDKSKCLCFQPHPEFDPRIEGADSTYNYFKNLLTRFYGEI